jgi:hypothetical protein
MSDTFLKIKRYINKHILNIEPIEDYLPVYVDILYCKSTINYYHAIKITHDYEGYSSEEKAELAREFSQAQKELDGYYNFAYCSPITLSKAMLYETGNHWKRELIEQINYFEPYIKFLKKEHKKIIQDEIYKMCQIVLNPNMSFGQKETAIYACHRKINPLVPTLCPLGKILLSIVATALCLMVTTAILGMPFTAIGCGVSAVGFFALAAHTVRLKGELDFVTEDAMACVRVERSNLPPNEQAVPDNVITR